MLKNTGRFVENQPVFQTIQLFLASCIKIKKLMVKVKLFYRVILIRILETKQTTLNWQKLQGIYNKWRNL